MSDMEGEEEKKELDLSSNEVVTKYKLAAEIANKALATVVSECKPGAKVLDLCEKGDSLINQECSTKYTKKKVDKGVAFPTCVSVNNIVCHYSATQNDEKTLQEGDMVKIDLGCHIDGFAAVVAHTIVLQDASKPVTGRAADVMKAAEVASEVLLRLVRPGKKNTEAHEALKKIAEVYDVKASEGVLSHQMKQFVIDGNKVVLSVSNAETRVDEFEFEENEVYAIDVVMTTGDGKSKLLDEKQTSVYKRALDKTYHLKMNASRSTFGEINQRFPVMPFTIRELKDKKARLGLVECVNHELLVPYPVLHEKPDALVAHFKFTVLLMPNGSDRITGHPIQALEPTKQVEDPEVKAWLALGTKSKKKGGGAKKKAKKGHEGESEGGVNKDGAAAMETE